MATLSFQHINKVYDNYVQAVFDFNLEVKDKEFIVLVGPSGCGKSTTLRMLAGLEEISSGDLYIDGENVNDVEPKDRNIAMVFQSYALYPHMSVYDNMAFSLVLKHVDKAEIRKRVNDAAEILGLTQYLDRKPKALSGGQRQRVALGRAIVREPKVFLMDEPLSNLDAKLRVQMRNEISRIHKAVGATTVYVTHDQTEAMTMADRIVVMKGGYVQQIGTPKEVYNKPANTFVATFIGSPAMNMFKGTFNGESIAFDGESTFSIPAERKEALKSYAERMVSKMDEEDVETREAIVQVEDEIANLKKKRGNKKIIKQYEEQLKTLTAEIEKIARRKEAYLAGSYKVIFGVRPEDVHAEGEDIVEHPSQPIPVKADITELLGSELIIYGTYNGQDITAKAKASNEICQGDTVTYRFDMEKVHYFDEESGERID